MNQNPVNPIKRVGLCVLVAALAACAPNFNWREVHPEGEELTYLLPCKPGVAEKEVDWGAGAQALSMQGCEAQGFQFTLAWLTVQPSTDVGALEGLWLKASWASLNGANPQALSQPTLLKQEALVGKLTTTLGSRAYFEGQNERGMQVHWAWFTKGHKLYQAGIYKGASAPAQTAKSTLSQEAQKDALETFFESFR